MYIEYVCKYIYSVYIYIDSVCMYVYIYILYIIYKLYIILSLYIYIGVHMYAYIYIYTRATHLCMCYYFGASWHHPPFASGPLLYLMAKTEHV